jgi:hypothetical protein
MHRAGWKWSCVTASQLASRRTSRPWKTSCSPLRALTTGLRWSNHEGHEGHEDGIRRYAESNERLCDRGSLAPRAGTTIWHRTLLSLIPSCSSFASWSTDRPTRLPAMGIFLVPWRTNRSTGAGESFGFELKSHVRPPGDLGRWAAPSVTLGGTSPWRKSILPRVSPVRPAERVGPFAARGWSACPELLR